MAFLRRHSRVMVVIAAGVLTSALTYHLTG
jgi:hypothetical protein